MAHTGGEWEYIVTTGTVWAGTPGFRDHVIVSKCDRSALVTAETAQANGFLIALAPTAPHDCDLPSCPGAANKRKLEAAEKLYAVAKSVEWEGDCGECPSCGEVAPTHWKDCRLNAAIEAYERGL